MLYIGSDHGGFKLKEELKDFLQNEKITFQDVGPKQLDPEDDYPVFASKAATAVSKDPKNNKAILLCRSGHGVCIAANKFKNVRAALCWDEQVAKASRNDDDANILCLPSDYMSPETAEHIVRTWLNTPFSEAERHQRRIDEVKKMEGN